MLFPQASSTTFMATILAFFLFLFFLLWILRKARKTTLPPEAGGAWPLIGHLHLLGGTKPAHITLGNMADKYGPIFTIQLGVHRALIVSSWEIAKECFTTNDKAFANRPKAIASELMGYNYALFILSPYGPYWRQVRKIATVEVLSNHRLEMLKHIREYEVNRSIKEMYELWVKNNNMLVDMQRWFGTITLNIIFRMVVGKRFFGTARKDENEFNDQCRNTLKEVFELSGTVVVADALPYLRWFDFGGYERAMKHTAKEFDHMIKGWLQEHKQRKLSGEAKEPQDFMDVMLSVVASDEKISDYDGDTITKATCLAVILGGTDTTQVTMTWVLSLLLNNQEVLKKAQQELDVQVGRERQVKESDIKNLVYLQAIIKESTRLYAAGALTIPHESTEDCTLAGYHVPKGTRLIVNLSKMHRDPHVWSNPNEFQPERFLSTHKGIDVKGQHFELTPFGAGRRMCPGVSFALQVMQLTFATLLHAFDIATPSNEPVDMTEKVGLTNQKLTPIEVHLTPRLPAQVYAWLD
ncbi:cytochrome P450 CYP82D47-like [Corylus avellana]|uniref:cytochrome P450 CYP82D47-like n=1 Tax=Corylus avellana TaxID=13451 RepID=UPI00286D67B5|nr:cytochrome P450 CYP82D47-like [Corylus avellana]